jgi:hypothetical protein
LSKLDETAGAVIVAAGALVGAVVVATGAVVGALVVAAGAVVGAVVVATGAVVVGALVVGAAVVVVLGDAVGAGADAVDVAAPTVPNEKPEAAVQDAIVECSAQLP